MDAELFLKSHANKTVILDEIQLMPSLFGELRSLIDEQREPRGFILLGSASPDLIRSSADSLAGRVGYLELTPFFLPEIEESEDEKSWIRGGFPNSFLAKTGRESKIWRQNFIKTYLEKDLAQIGLNTDRRLVERFWMMLANAQGEIWNGEAFARAGDYASHGQQLFEVSGRFVHGQDFAAFPSQYQKAIGEISQGFYPRLGIAPHAGGGRFDACFAKPGAHWGILGRVCDRAV